MQAFQTAKRRKSPAPRRLRLPRTDDTVPYCASLPVLIRRRINGGYPVAERNQDARALGNDERRLSRRLAWRFEHEPGRICYFDQDGKNHSPITRIIPGDVECLTALGAGQAGPNGPISIC